jgi:excisionase family DNA binding protein
MKIVRRDREHSSDRLDLLGFTEIEAAHPSDTAEGSSLIYREVMTTEQAADYLGLSVGALRNMASNGQVPYRKLGRRNRYLLVELRQLLLSEKRGSCHGNKK